MLKQLRQLSAELRTRIHSFALGTTLALAVIFAGQLGQTCAATGG